MPRQFRGGMLAQSALQDFPQQILLLGREFLALRGEVEHVNCFLAFRIDKRHFDVTGKPGESRAHVVKEARAILNDHFEQSAVCRSGIVETEARLDGNFWRTSAAGGIAALQQRLQLGFVLKNVVQALDETFLLRRIQFERPVQVKEMERVQYNSRRVCERVCFDDVHAPSGKHPGNSGEKSRAIRGEQGESEAMALGCKLSLKSRRAQFLVKRKMPRDFRR